MGKKVLIIADLEGIIGMTPPMNLTSPEKNMAEQLRFTAQCIINKEKNCLIDICNVHNDGTLLKNSPLNDTCCRLMRGINGLKHCDWNYAYCIMIGFHGMSGTGGFYDHTFRPDILQIHREGISEYLGEVGTLILWMHSKGIPVALVSGEGFFDSEVLPFSIPVHKVGGMSITEQYLAFESALNDALTTAENAVRYSDHMKIAVKIDNPDKIALLTEKGFHTTSSEVLFKNINDFFFELYRLAVELNKAAEYIIRLNTEFAKQLAAQNISFEDCRNMQQLFQKPLDLISASDRETIKSRLLI